MRTVQARTDVRCLREDRLHGLDVGLVVVSDDGGRPRVEMAEHLTEERLR